MTEIETQRIASCSEILLFIPKVSFVRPTLALTLISHYMTLHSYTCVSMKGVGMGLIPSSRELL